MLFPAKCKMSYCYQLWRVTFFYFELYLTDSKVLCIILFPAGIYFLKVSNKNANGHNVINKILTPFVYQKIIIPFSFCVLCLTGHQPIYALAEQVQWLCLYEYGRIGKTNEWYFLQSLQIFSHFEKNIPQCFLIIMDGESLVHILKPKEVKTSGHYCKDLNGRVKLLFKHSDVTRTDVKLLSKTISNRRLVIVEVKA